MSARLTAILDFVGSRFQAGIARANAAVSGLGRTVGKMKTAFAGFGGLGGLLGIGGISKLWQDATKMAEDALARMDFSKISQRNAAAIVSAKRDFESLFQTITGGAAIAFAKVTDSFRKVGAFFGSLTAGDTIKQAIDAANAESKAAEEAAIAEAQREAAFARMTKTVASGLDIMAKKRLENAKAAEKEAKAVLEAEEAQQAGSPSYAQAKLEEASLLRDAALDPSKRRDILKDIKNQDRDDRRFNKLLASADKKLASPFRMSSKLTRAEKLALASRDAENAGKQALPHIAEYTKEIRDIIKDALVIQK